MVEEEEDDAEEEEKLTDEQINRALFENENDICSSARLRMNVMMPTGPSILEEGDIEMNIVDAPEAE